MTVVDGGCNLRAPKEHWRECLPPPVACVMGVLYVCSVKEYRIHAVDECCSAVDRLGQEAMDDGFVAECCLLHSCLVSLSGGRERPSFVLGVYRVLMRKSSLNIIS